MSGNRYEFGSLEEGLAVKALNRRAEIEFTKTMVIVNAIISSGNMVAAAASGGESSGFDALNKTIDGLKEILLPHWKESADLRAAKAKETLQRELDQGPLKVKVVGKGEKGTRRR